MQFACNYTNYTSIDTFQCISWWVGVVRKDIGDPVTDKNLFYKNRYQQSMVSQIW